MTKQKKILLSYLLKQYKQEKISEDITPFYGQPHEDQNWVWVIWVGETHQPKNVNKPPDYWFSTKHYAQQFKRKNNIQGYVSQYMISDESLRKIKRQRGKWIK